MTLISSVVGAINGTGSKILTNYVAAVVILLVGFIVARLIGLISSLLLRELSLNQLVSKYTGFSISIEEILTTVFVYATYFFTIIMALNQIELTTKIFHAISIAVIIIIGISIGIAIKDFMPNLVAGLYLLHVNHLGVGDKIKIDNIEGKIEEIHLLESRIKTKDKDSLLVPNSTMLKKMRRVSKALKK